MEMYVGEAKGGTKYWLYTANGELLGLIRQWLRAPVVEPPTKEGGTPTVNRNDRGTPQGGVLSPLLANIYLHWFDHLFQRADGPAEWARAKLTRYADDFVVQAKYMGTRLREWIEGGECSLIIVPQRFLEAFGEATRRPIERLSLPIVIPLPLSPAWQRLPAPPPPP